MLKMGTDENLDTFKKTYLRIYKRTALYRIYIKEW